MKFVGIIPARYESSRFPGKPLCVIEGKSMIQRVYEQCTKTSVLSVLAVATDDQRIYEHVISFGGKALMTDHTHSCGTDRCNEAFSLLKTEYKLSDDDVVVNIQGDEPLIDPKQIEIVCSLFHKKEVKIGTLVRKIDSEVDLLSNTVQKVVIDKFNRAMYFSRTPIPFLRGADPKDWLGKHPYFLHIGIYAYVASVLAEIVKMPQSSLEKAEALEQLRWLENGYPVHAGFTNIPSHAVDVPSDVDKIVKFLTGE